MDTLLENGDHTVDGRGVPLPVEGIGELLQRALIRLSVPKGSFAYDPALGSELHRLNACTPEAQRKALAYAQEALSPLPQLRVLSAGLSAPLPDALVLALEISLQSRMYNLEVTIV